ncbi:cation:proton antiporter [Candidatus Woesearchaeota archaeon]|nr:cation:proton antiporter [Candidatus Woesearchaeota archaeon]
MDVNTMLLGVSLIIIFGFFAEFIFKKFGIPDLLLLVLLGFAIGPQAMNLVPEAILVGIRAVAPLFTSFALLFLMFEGSLSIDLRSFTRGVGGGLALSFFNFIISSIVITVILIALKYDLLLSILIGFALSGVSSAFVMPLLKQLRPKGEVHTMLALESALTDVFTIVFALTMMELIKVNVFSFRAILGQVISLFAVAGMMGILGAALWIFLDKKVFKEHKSFMSTISIIILIYFITEFLGGNGAIAALFFGLVMRNSKQLSSIIKGIAANNEKEKELGMKGELGIRALNEDEKLFYGQISFFLKTFFFVYMGLLINVRDLGAIFIGGVLALAVLAIRNLSQVLTRKMDKHDRTLISSVFARGLAAAAVIQIVVENGIITSSRIVDIIYFFIICTIILSSIRVFIYKSGLKKSLEAAKAQAAN